MTIVYKLCLFNFRRVESLTLPLALNFFSMTSFRYCRKRIPFSSVEERSLALRARANEPAIENTRSTPAEVAGRARNFLANLDRTGYFVLLFLQNWRISVLSPGRLSFKYFVTSVPSSFFSASSRTALRLLNIELQSLACRSTAISVLLELIATPDLLHSSSY